MLHKNHAMGFTLWARHFRRKYPWNLMRRWIWWLKWLSYGADWSLEMVSRYDGPYLYLSLIVTYRYTTAPWSLAFLIFSNILPRAGTTSPLWSGPLQPKCARIEMLIEKEHAAATSTRVYLKLGCTPQISRFMGHFQTHSVACNLQLAAQSPRRTAACLQSSMLWVHWGFLTTNEF